MRTEASSWRMTVYDVLDGASISAGPPRFLYARRGPLHVATASGETVLDAEKGQFLCGGMRIAGNGLGWLYEVADQSRTAACSAATPIVLSRPLPVATPGTWLLRVDRVAMPAGFVTPRHGHRGPGIRRLLSGRILAAIADRVDRIDTGQAWFESGPEPVVGTNLHSDFTVFVRVMLLPQELLGGQSSYLPADADEAAKPRGVTIDVLGETLIQLGAS
ncbi:MAG: hypothetical protein ACREFP_04815 [Acetobacteraceae bacterium]